MDIILVSNVSANGKVLLANTPNYQTPQEAMEIFMQAASQTGNIVLGRKTFEIFQNIPGVMQGFSGVELVLLSATTKGIEGYKTVATPEEAISYLAEKGFSKIAVFGGTQTYNAFLDKNLITDVSINVHPVIVGHGGVLATDDKVITRFNLYEHKPLVNGILQLNLKRIEAQVEV